MLVSIEELVAIDKAIVNIEVVEEPVMIEMAAVVESAMQKCMFFFLQKSSFFSPLQKY